MHASLADQPTTLEQTLRPHAVPPTELLRRYPAVVPLVGRILGVIPRSFSYQEIWPPAMVTYGLTVPALMDIPFCDAGLGIGHEARSLVAYAASRSHGCMYCSAHCAALGNVFRGAKINLEHNAAAIKDGVCQLPSARDRALIDFGMAVAKLPAPPIASAMQALAQHFSPAQIEKIVLVAANMGMLNRCMDTFGMVLEGKLLEMARSQLVQSGWQEGPVFDPARDRGLLAAEQTGAQLPELGPLQLAVTMARAIRFEVRALSGIPSTARGVDRLLTRKLGFVPDYVHRFGSLRVRRTLAHLLCERLMNAGEGLLGPALRCAICLLAARTSKNRLLAAHFAYLGERCAGASGFRSLLDGKQADPATRAAFDFARGGAAVPPALEPALISCLAEQFPPAGRVELVMTLSIYSLLQRLTAAFPLPAPEPVIARFLDERGRAYDLGQNLGNHLGQNPG